jgi:hypothetical protein
MPLKNVARNKIRYVMPSNREETAGIPACSARIDAGEMIVLVLIVKGDYFK